MKPFFIFFGRTFFFIATTFFSTAHLLASPASNGFLTSDAPYLKALVPHLKIIPLITVGDLVPKTTNGNQGYRLIGVPDGMGLYADEKGLKHLLVSHELKKNAESEPMVGQPSLRGATVSEFILSSNPLSVLSGNLAFDSIVMATHPQPVMGQLARLCSGFLAGPWVGFDRPIYLAGEEADPRESFDGKGGQAFAIFDRKAHLLPGMGHFRKENMVVVPFTGSKTVAFVLEDGPKGFNSELFLYVGQKNPQALHPLEKNGLVGGKLYVFVSSKKEISNESSLHKNSPVLEGKWMLVSGIQNLSESELNQKLKNLNAFTFDRIEDGTYDRSQPGLFYFVVTGGSTLSNPKGRLYKLSFDPQNPETAPTFLDVVLEGARGDPILSPDNLDMNDQGVMMIQEDFTMATALTAGRPPSIWFFKPQSGELKRIAETNAQAIVDETTMMKPWESSGIIDASAFFGPGSWIANVQAHSVNSQKAGRLKKLKDQPKLVEGGQILLLFIEP